MAADSRTKARKGGDEVFSAIWKAYRTLMTRAEQSQKVMGLGGSDFRVLESLAAEGSLPVSVIGSRVDLTTGSITTAIDRLEHKWLVVRKPQAGDRRVRVVELTSRGRRLIEKCSAQHRQEMEKATLALSVEERGLLIRLLSKMGAANEQTD